VGLNIGASHLFVVDSADGAPVGKLNIFSNLGDPSHDSFSGGISSDPQSIEIVGIKAYVLQSGHLTLLNIADPSAPVVIETISDLGGGNGLKVFMPSAQSSTAYIGYSGGLKTLYGGSM